MLGTWGEIALIAVMALILIGPKELPAVLRMIGRIRQKMFHLQQSFKDSVDPYIQGGEVDEYDKHIREKIGANIKRESFQGYGDESPERGPNPPLKQKRKRHETPKQ